MGAPPPGKGAPAGIGSPAAATPTRDWPRALSLTARVLCLPDRCPLLRPLLHDTLATMIMYYQVRFAEKEMHMVLTYMREAYIETIAAPGEDAHFKIIELGTEIRRQFELDNLRLTARQGANGHERIIHAIQQLGSSTANLHLRVNHMAARQEIQDGKLDTIIGMLTSLSSGTPIATVATAAGTSSSPIPIPLRAAPPRASLAPSPAPSPAPASPEPAARTFSFPSFPSSSSSAQRSSPLVPSSMQPRSGKFANYTLVDKRAAQLFLDTTANGGVVPQIQDDKDGKRLADANKCCDAFKAMANTTEYALLTSNQRNESEAVQIVIGLVKLLCVRIREAYIFIGKEAPKKFGVTPPLVSTIAENARNSKVIVESSSFTKWRTAYESPKTTAVPPPPPPEEEDSGPPSKRLRPGQDDAVMYDDRKDDEEEEASEDSSEEEYDDESASGAATSSEDDDAEDGRSFATGIPLSSDDNED